MGRDRAPGFRSAGSSEHNLPAKSKGTSASTQSPSTTQPVPSSTRRSQRVSIVIPILVYGRRKDGRPYQEETHSLVVNAHGGLILLAEPVELEQKLLLTNPKPMKQATVRVVYRGRRLGAKTEIGVEFS